MQNVFAENTTVQREEKKDMLSNMKNTTENQDDGLLAGRQNFARQQLVVDDNFEYDYEENNEEQNYDSIYFTQQEGRPGNENFQQGAGRCGSSTLFDDARSIERNQKLYFNTRTLIPEDKNSPLPSPAFERSSLSELFPHEEEHEDLLAGGDESCNMGRPELMCQPLVSSSTTAAYRNSEDDELRKTNKKKFCLYFLLIGGAVLLTLIGGVVTAVMLTRAGANQQAASHVETGPTSSRRTTPAPDGNLFHGGIATTGIVPPPTRTTTSSTTNGGATSSSSSTAGHLSPGGAGPQVQALPVVQVVPPITIHDPREDHVGTTAVQHLPVEEEEEVHPQLEVLQEGLEEQPEVVEELQRPEVDDEEPEQEPEEVEVVEPLSPGSVQPETTTDGTTEVPTTRPDESLGVEQRPEVEETPEQSSVQLDAENKPDDDQQQVPAPTSSTSTSQQGDEHHLDLGNKPKSLPIDLFDPDLDWDSIPWEIRDRLTRLVKRIKLMRKTGSSSASSSGAFDSRRSYLGGYLGGDNFAEDALDHEVEESDDEQSTDSSTASKKKAEKDDLELPTSDSTTPQEVGHHDQEKHEKVDAEAEKKARKQALREKTRNDSLDNLRLWYEQLVKSYNMTHNFTIENAKRPLHILFEAGGKTELGGAYPLMKELAQKFNVKVTLLAPFGKLVRRSSSSPAAAEGGATGTKNKSIYFVDAKPGVEAPALPKHLELSHEQDTMEHENPETDTVLWNFGIPPNDWKKLEAAGIRVIPLKPRGVVRDWLFSQTADDSVTHSWGSISDFTEKFITNYVVRDSPVDFVVTDCYAAWGGVAKTLMEKLRVPGSIWCGNFHGAWAARWVLNKTLPSKKKNSSSVEKHFPTFVSHFLPLKVSMDSPSYHVRPILPTKVEACQGNVDKKANLPCVSCKMPGPDKWWARVPSMALVMQKTVPNCTGGKDERILRKLEQFGKNLILYTAFGRQGFYFSYQALEELWTGLMQVPENVLPYLVAPDNEDFQQIVHERREQGRSPAFTWDEFSVFWRETQYKKCVEFGTKQKQKNAKFCADLWLHHPNAEKAIIVLDAPQKEIFQFFPGQVMYVAHGGAGGLTEAIGLGVPIICVPMLFSDQPANCRAIERAELGINLSESLSLKWKKNKLVMRPGGHSLHTWWDENGNWVSDDEYKSDFHKKQDFISTSSSASSSSRSGTKFLARSSTSTVEAVDPTSSLQAAVAHMAEPKNLAKYHENLAQVYKQLEQEALEREHEVAAFVHELAQFTDMHPTVPEGEVKFAAVARYSSMIEQEQQEQLQDEDMRARNSIHLSLDLGGSGLKSMFVKKVHDCHDRGSQDSDTLSVASSTSSNSVCLKPAVKAQLKLTNDRHDDPFNWPKVGSVGKFEMVADEVRLGYIDFDSLKQNVSPRDWLQKKLEDMYSARSSDRTSVEKFATAVDEFGVLQPHAIQHKIHVSFGLLSGSEESAEEIGNKHGQITFASGTNLLSILQTVAANGDTYKLLAPTEGEAVQRLVTLQEEYGIDLWKKFCYYLDLRVRKCLKDRNTNSAWRPLSHVFDARGMKSKSDTEAHLVAARMVLRDKALAEGKRYDSNNFVNVAAGTNLAISFRKNTGQRMQYADMVRKLIHRNAEHLHQTNLSELLVPLPARLLNQETKMHLYSLPQTRWVWHAQLTEAQKREEENRVFLPAQVVLGGNGQRDNRVERYVADLSWTKFLREQLAPVGREFYRSEEQEPAKEQAGAIDDNGNSKNGQEHDLQQHTIVPIVLTGGQASGIFNAAEEDTTKFQLAQKHGDSPVTFDLITGGDAYVHCGTVVAAADGTSAEEDYSCENFQLRDTQREAEAIVFSQSNSSRSQTSENKSEDIESILSEEEDSTDLDASEAVDASVESASTTLESTLDSTESSTFDNVPAVFTTSRTAGTTLFRNFHHHADDDEKPTSSTKTSQESQPRPFLERNNIFGRRASRTNSSGGARNGSRNSSSSSSSSVEVICGRNNDRRSSCISQVATEGPGDEVKNVVAAN
ncbi:unnamed protein product [Amoebophrya sp. A120]|nr:unnamed protein product [Amoebophrya sp. A120]|eukprot:GSA120T00024143001.1